MNKLCILFFIIVFFAGYSLAQDGVVWRRVDENNFINPDGIVGTPEGFTFMLKAFNKGQYLEYKIGVIDSYDYEDNFVNGDYNRYAKFQPIVSGTAVGEVAKLYCKF